MQTDQQLLDQLHALAERIVAPEAKLPFQVPGLGVAIERANGTGARLFTGVDAAGAPFGADALFPVASATKLATGMAVLRLVQDGRIVLDDPIGSFLPEARAAAAGVTPRMLLSHTSGLPVEIRPDTYTWSEGFDWRAIARASLETPLQFSPRERVQYSNIGFALLAQMVERILDMEFNEALERLVIAPLGIEAYFGRRELPRPAAVIMDVDSEHVGTPLDPINSGFARSLASPAAGLVTTLTGLLSLLRVYTGSRPDLLGSRTIAEARSDQSGGLSGGFGTNDPFMGGPSSHVITWPHCAWGLMLELHGEKRQHWAPPTASPESFGQIGSTGCLAWYDPGRDVLWGFMAPRTTDSGWLLRHGGAIGNVALRSATGATPVSHRAGAVVTGA